MLAHVRRLRGLFKPISRAETEGRTRAARWIRDHLFD